MSENDGVTLRSIHWLEIFPWLSIARSFRLAVTLRLLVLGAAAILLTLLGWWCFACWAFSGDPQAKGFWVDQFGESSPWAVIDHAVPDRPFLPGVAELRHAAPTGASTWHATDPFFGSWATLSRPVWKIFTEPAMSPAALACLVLSSLWSLAVWGFFGGAITRIAAVELATEERVGWGAAFRWATSKWPAYAGAPLFPLLGILIVVIPMLLLGLFMRANPGLLLVGLIWPAALVGGMVMALLLLGLIFGWPLMWATISAEGTDSFDALSRTYAYAFQRPLRYLFYAVVAAILGGLGWLLVANFAAAVIWLAHWATGWGSGAERMQEIAQGELATVGATGAKLMAFWAGCVKWLALGYTFAYFWTAVTAIYLLLRRDVDATEMDEVFLDADESEQNFGQPSAPAPAPAPAPASEPAAPQVPERGPDVPPGAVEPGQPATEVQP